MGEGSLVQVDLQSGSDSDSAASDNPLLHGNKGRKEGKKFFRMKVS